MNKSWLQQKLDVIGPRELGKGPYPYSGREMNGRYCIAINVHSQDMAYGVMATLGAMSYEDNFEKLTSPKTDPIGHGLILYWPDVLYVA